MSEKLLAVKRLVEAEIEKAKKFLGGVAAEAHELTGAVRIKRGCETHDCSCGIPTPCWLPEDLGDADVNVEGGDTAHLTMRVRNTDGQQRNVTAQVTGSGSQLVAPAAASMMVTGFGWGTFSFSVAVPHQSPAGTYADVQIAIQGCRRHVINWRVITVEKCETKENADVEIVVCDGAELIHHWYDHFYCRRPCQAADVQ
jgi:hypothetical protein